MTELLDCVDACIEYDEQYEQDHARDVETVEDRVTSLVSRVINDNHVEVEVQDETGSRP